jgi:hypothetical protein
MRKERIITPLSEFPTEVLVFEFKRNRRCYHRTSYGDCIGYRKQWYPHWENVEGLGYIINYYTMENVPIFDDKSFDETTTQFSDDTLYFSFEGKYWNGSLRALKQELEKRPNVNITLKNFRKWKKKYKRSEV